jgi:hypothetical protein
MTWVWKLNGFTGDVAISGLSGASPDIVKVIVGVGGGTRNEALEGVVGRITLPESLVVGVAIGVAVTLPKKMSCPLNVPRPSSSTVSVSLSGVRMIGGLGVLRGNVE